MRKELDVLLHAVFEDGEVVFVEPGHEAAFPVEKRDRDAHRIHAHAELRTIRLWILAEDRDRQKTEGQACERSVPHDFDSRTAASRFSA